MVSPSEPGPATTSDERAGPPGRPPLFDALSIRPELLARMVERQSWQPSRWSGLGLASSLISVRSPLDRGAAEQPAAWPLGPGEAGPAVISPQEFFWWRRRAPLQALLAARGGAWEVVRVHRSRRPVPDRPGVPGTGQPDAWPDGLPAPDGLSAPDGLPAPDALPAPIAQSAVDQSPLVMDQAPVVEAHAPLPVLAQAPPEDAPSPWSLAGLWARMASWGREHLDPSPDAAAAPAPAATAATAPTLPAPTPQITPAPEARADEPGTSIVQPEETAAVVDQVAELGPVLDQPDVLDEAPDRPAEADASPANAWTAPGTPAASWTGRPVVVSASAGLNDMVVPLVQALDRRRLVRLPAPYDQAPARTESPARLLWWPTVESPAAGAPPAVNPTVAGPPARIDVAVPSPRLAASFENAPTAPPTAPAASFEGEPPLPPDGPTITELMAASGPFSSSPDEPPRRMRLRSFRPPSRTPAPPANAQPPAAASEVSPERESVAGPSSANGTDARLGLPSAPDAQPALAHVPLNPLWRWEFERGRGFAASSEEIAHISRMVQAAPGLGGELLHREMTAEQALSIAAPGQWVAAWLEQAVAARPSFAQPRPAVHATEESTLDHAVFGSGDSYDSAPAQAGSFLSAADILAHLDAVESGDSGFGGMSPPSWPSASFQGFTPTVEPPVGPLPIVPGTVIGGEPLTGGFPVPRGYDASGVLTSGSAPSGSVVPGTVIAGTSIPRPGPVVSGRPDVPMRTTPRFTIPQGRPVQPGEPGQQPFGQAATDAPGLTWPGDIGLPGGGPVAGAPFDPSMLPEHPELHSDDELAAIIASLPGPMRDAALAAGVLGSTPVPPPPTGSAQARVESQPYPQRTFAQGYAAPPGPPRGDVGTAAPADSYGPAWSGSPAAVAATPSPPDDRFDFPPTVLATGYTPPATPASSDSADSSGAPNIAFAPADRPVPGEGTFTAPGAAGGDAATPAEGQAPDLERLANDVYDLLRWRAAGERERSIG